MNDNHSPAVFTRERVLTAVLALLTLIVIWVCYRIIQPFVPAIAFALALAVATQAPFSWLRRRVRSEPAAAAIAVILVALLIIGPAAFLITYVVQTAAESIGDLQQGTGENLQQKLETVPVIGGLVREVSSRFRLEEQLGSIGKAVAGRATGVLSTSINFLTQLGVTLFVLFFLYRDCGQAVHTLRSLLPLSNREADQMFERVASTISATVNGSLTVALIQALLAGTVYAILGVPGSVLWGAATFLMALVPVLGTFLVWAPIALWLGLTGHIGKALFLVAWGGLVVGSIDNILYPWLVGGKLRLHTVPTFFSVLGGISLFGPAGLILGPLMVAIAIALVDVWFHRTEHGHAAEQAVSQKAEAPQGPGGLLQEHGK